MRLTRPIATVLAIVLSTGLFGALAIAQGNEATQPKSPVGASSSDNGRMTGSSVGPSSSESGMGMMGSGMMARGTRSQGMTSGEQGAGMPPMMGSCMGMEMMKTMMSDPKTRAQMMEIHGRMMQQMGELMVKRAEELEQGK